MSMQERMYYRMKQYESIKENVNHCIFVKNHKNNNMQYDNKYDNNYIDNNYID